MKMKQVATIQQHWQNLKTLAKPLIHFEQIPTKNSKKLWESLDESQSTFQATRESQV